MNITILSKSQLFIKLIKVKYQIHYAKGFHLTALKILHDKLLTEYKTR